MSTIYRLAYALRVPPAVLLPAVGEEVGELCWEALERVIESIHTPGDHISEIALLKTQIKDGVSRFLYEQTKRRPMVFPVVVEV